MSQDGSATGFYDVLRHQFLDERLQHYQAIEDALLDAAEKKDDRSCDIVTQGNVSAACLKAHPQMAPEAVTEILARVFGDAASAGTPTAGGKARKVKKDAPLHDALRRLRVGWGAIDEVVVEPVVGAKNQKPNQKKK